MDQNEIQKAESVVNESTKDIKRLIGGYNFHLQMAQSYRNPDSIWRNNLKWPNEKIHGMAEWHEYIFSRLCEKLHERHLLVREPNFFDGSTFEHSSAPGLKIQANIGGNFEILVDPYNLEEDLKDHQWFKNLCQDHQFASELYSALCNVEWKKNEIHWSCSWRYAGGIVAELRQCGEDYIDFYCGGNEGTVTDRIGEQLLKLGWTPILDE